MLSSKKLQKHETAPAVNRNEPTAAERHYGAGAPTTMGGTGPMNTASGPGINNGMHTNQAGYGAGQEHVGTHRRLARGSRLTSFFSSVVHPRLADLMAPLKVQLAMVETAIYRHQLRWVVAKDPLLVVKSNMPSVHL